MAELDPRDNPRPQHERDALSDGWRDRGYGYVGPIIAVAVLLLVGLLIFSNYDADDQSGARVGQNVERPATNPETPRNPNTMPKQ